MPALLSALAAINSTHKGPDAPSYKIAGLIWIDDTSDPTWEIKLYDGGAWLTLFFLDTTNNLAYQKPVLIYDLIPGNPPANMAYVYFDATADQIKAKKSDGTMCVLGDFSP